MKIEESISYQCDICGIKVKNENNINEFSYFKEWRTGCHRGTTENRGHVCTSCDGSPLRRFIANSIAKVKK